MKIYFTDGRRVDTEIGAPMLYVLIRVVQSKQAETKIKANVGTHEFFISLEGVDLCATFASYALEDFAEVA